ncbi:MAG: dihydrodipicolinate synthase family protein [Planctomycetota bacterium]
MPVLESVRPVIRPQRQITGMSAILLPFGTSGEVDWGAFREHVARTHAAGLLPAVNMDTGYANLIDPATRFRALEETAGVLSDAAFIAGVFVGDRPDSTFDFDAYRRGVDEIQKHGGTPIFFQSYGLTSQDGDGIVASYRRMGEHAGEFLAFELGNMFAPFGKIYDLATYRGLMETEACTGAKHSSLRRDLEWQRLQLRDEVRPDFRVLTGNDLAIDMVMYGSDYLLGLSTFAPEAFAIRDRWWHEGDDRFYELNDLLQYLGFFAFRDPVPAYKHSAAQLLHLRGWIPSPQTHPNSPTRPESDVPILRDIVQRIDASCHA